ncbi:MAG TPA: hypothetical protein VIY48_12255 [Candidatus Paceibacterota bacterium]
MSRSVNLQRRHFEYLADIILGLKAHMSDDDHSKVATYFANMLSNTNYNFKWDRFYNRSRGLKPVPAKRVRAIERKVTKLAALEPDTNYWE